MVATLVRTTFAPPDAEQTWAQHARVVEQLETKFPDYVNVHTVCARAALSAVSSAITGR